jgi:squalene-hopene/tetraprenyl-beta-curcumene cyclase
MDSIVNGATKLGIGIAAVFIGANLLRAGAPRESQAPLGWNPTSAAAYLDQRAAWWMGWPGARRDHGTFCVSCHTALPYALGRPALRSTLGEKAPSDNERRLQENVVKRVRLWKEIEPFYAGPEKSLQSRGTESILNALILASADARNGRLSDDARAAFDHMWALQEKTGDQKGAWPWLDFGNEPFEAHDSRYYGAALAAVAVGRAPDNYRSTPEIQSNLKLLSDYIRREGERQSLMNQVVSLWASSKWPGLLAPSQQKSIIDNVLAKQTAGGGWGLSSMGWVWRGATLHTLVNLWVRSDDIPLARKSDGYATGLVVFVLEQAGFPLTDVHLQHGRSWLMANQNKTEGKWPGYSLVNRRDPSAGTGLFMSDAATAYAVLALTTGN